MVQFVHPDDSYSVLETLVNDADILKALVYTTALFHYGGDLSFSAAKCYDIEIWAPRTEVFRSIKL